MTNESYMVIGMGLMFVLCIFIMMYRYNKLSYAIKHRKITPPVFGELSYDKVINKDLMSIISRIADDEYDTYVLNYKDDRIVLMDRIRIPGNSEMETIISKTLCKVLITLSPHLLVNVYMFIAEDAFKAFCIDEIRMRFVRANEYYTNRKAEYDSANDVPDTETDPKLNAICYDDIISTYGNDMGDIAAKYGIHKDKIEEYRKKYLELTQIYKDRDLNYDMLTTSEKRNYDMLREIYVGSSDKDSVDDAFYKSPNFGK